MKSGYDLLAPVYDRLAYSIFGKALNEAQSIHLPKNQNNMRVLILGGGTGYTLERLLEYNQQLNIVNLDISAEMQRLSKKRVEATGLQKDHVINYVTLPFDNYTSENTFDYVIVPFFLDMFKEDEIDIIINKIKEHSVQNAKLIVTDFTIPESGWSRTKAVILTWVMYRFFKIATGISASALPAIHDRIEMKSFEVLKYESVNSNFIFSALYRIK